MKNYDKLLLCKVFLMFNFTSFISSNNGMILLSLEFYVIVKNMKSINEKLFYSRPWHAVVCFGVVFITALTVTTIGVTNAVENPKNTWNNSSNSTLECLVYREYNMHPYATNIGIFFFGALYLLISSIVLVMTLKTAYDNSHLSSLPPINKEGNESLERQSGISQSTTGQESKVNKVAAAPFLTNGQQNHLLGSSPIHSSTSFQQPMHLETLEATSQNQQVCKRQQAKVKQFKRMFQLILIILLMNTMTLLLVTLFYALVQFHVPSSDTGMQVSAIMILINSSGNVIKYIVGDKIFRELLIKLIKCKRR
jgi:hypothetical protein